MNEFSKFCFKIQHPCEVSVLYASITVISNSLIHTLPNLYLLATGMSGDVYFPASCLSHLTTLSSYPYFSHWAINVNTTRSCSFWPGLPISSLRAFLFRDSKWIFPSLAVTWLTKIIGSTKGRKVQ